MVERIAIEFGENGDSTRYLRDGWSNTESDLTWMIGFESRMTLPQMPDWDQCFFTMRVMPHTREEKLPSQRLLVAINNIIVGDWSLDDTTTVQCRIPPEVQKVRGPVNIRLFHPDAKAPSTIADIADDRPLAVAVFSAALSPNKLEAPSAAAPAFGSDHPPAVAASPSPRGVASSPPTAIPASPLSSGVAAHFPSGFGLSTVKGTLVSRGMTKFR